MSAQSTDGEVTAAVEDSRATISLRRPDKLNALTSRMWDDITLLVEQFSACPEVRIIVFAGTEAVFSAGADLGEVLNATRSPEAARQYCHRIVRTLLTIAACPVPTVAVVDGLASGGGVELAAATNHRLGTPRTSMQLPFATLGVVPDCFTMERLRVLVGQSFAQWLVLRGQPVDAETCLRRGLLDEIVAVDQTDAVLDSLTRRVSALSPNTLAATRRLLSTASPARDVARIAAPMVESFLSGEVELAARRFAERRSRRH